MQHCLWFGKEPEHRLAGTGPHSGRIWTCVCTMSHVTPHTSHSHVYLAVGGDGTEGGAGVRRPGHSAARRRQVEGVERGAVVLPRVQ